MPNTLSSSVCKDRDTRHEARRARVHVNRENGTNQTAGTSPAIDHILISAVVALSLHAAAVVHLALLSPVLIALLLIGTVAAIETAGRGAEHAMMTGVVTGDAANQGALDAALGLGGLRRRQRECGNR